MTGDETIVINDVPCYLSTGRDQLPHDTIVVNAVAFYSDEAIRKAKDVIFKLGNEKPITRKQCNKHPNPNVADLKDILTILQTMEDKNFVLTRFGASGFNSLPPANGFESVASVLCSLIDEIMTVFGL